MQSVPITTDVVSLNLDQGRYTTLCDQVCQWFATGQWFSPVSSTNKTDRHDIPVHVTEILLKVALNTIKQTNKQYFELFEIDFCLSRHTLWKESLNSDGHQFHQYQQNNHLSS